jgi:peptidoglycan/LPS O-acetylase OafA/YrhL
MLKQGVSPEFLIQSLLFVPAENPGNYHNVLPVITVGWTLNLEMMFYLIVGASLFIKLPQRWLAIVTAMAVLQLLLAPLEIVNVFYSTPLLYEFLMGIAAAHLWKAGVLRGPSWLFAGLAVLALALLLRASPNSATHVIDCGVPAFLLVCAFVGCERHFQHAGLLKRLGDHSYSVYLVHPTIFYIGWYVYQQTKIRHGLLSIACLAAIALIGAASYHLVERPAGRWLTRLLGPRTGA